MAGFSRQGHFHFAEVCGGVEANHVRDGFHHVVQIDPPANRAALLNRIRTLCMMSWARRPPPPHR